METSGTKFATDWASKDDWVGEREVKSTLVDEYRFVTFALESFKLSAVHRKRKSDRIRKKDKEKTPRDLEPADTTIHTREDGPTIHQCGDSNVTCKWINGQYSLVQRKNWPSSKKTYTHDGKGRLPVPFQRLITS